MKSKVWVTKYALTEGVLECDLEEVKNDMAVVVWPGGMNGTVLFFGKDWHTSPGLAIERASQMRKRKIASLNKQIARVQGLMFTMDTISTKRLVSAG